MLSLVSLAEGLLFLALFIYDVCVIIATVLEMKLMACVHMGWLLMDPGFHFICYISGLAGWWVRGDNGNVSRVTIYTFRV